MNVYTHQVYCMQVLALFVLCAHRERMTCDAVAMLYCAQYAAMYRVYVTE
jgi:hypothetical protein